MRIGRLARALAISCLALLPSAAWAQSSTTGAIAGVAKDDTGAVLPGVTVEAASPALIEKVRTVVTDDQGNYKIVNLRPGTYSVTFSLSGFSSFKREGIEVSLGATAAVNGDLKIGSLEETVTVTGASPVVDVQNVRTQQTVTQEQLNAIPTAKSYVGMGAITLGASGGGGYTGTGGNRDVGGSQGEGVNSLSIHGSRQDGGFNIEGMRANSLTGQGFNRRFMTNQDAIQESVAETSGQSAETETGGVSVNMIVREGGNSFHGLAETEYTGKGLQNGNITDDLRARGVTGDGNKEQYIYSTGGGIGGPIQRDKVWFYSAARFWGTKENQAGIFFNKPELQHTLRYEPDLTRPGFTDTWVRDSTSRLTYQVAEKHKVSGVLTIQKLCSCRNGLSATRAPENTTFPVIGPGYLGQVNWSNPRTNKVLFEAGFAVRFGGVNNLAGPELNATDIGVLETSTGINYGPQVGAPGAGGPYGYIGLSKQYNTMAAMSYITGSHAFKFGEQSIIGENPTQASVFNNDFPVQYQFRNGIPFQLLQVASPTNYFTRVKNIGLFAQDQWTISKLTLNLGVRFDYLNAYSPAVDRPAGYFLPALHFDKAENLPNWKDISPRLGAAYDVFGNGRTAVKVAIGRYVVSEASTIAQNRNPQGALAVTTTRTWNDANGNFSPDCDLRNNASNGECGATSNRSFGTTVFTNNYDTAFTDGFAVRTYNWQTNATIQQDLGHGMALMAGYFRTWYGNITVNENVAVTPADFDTFCVTAPTDARLGDASGTRICGLYDIKPSAFGLANNVIHVDDGRSEVFNGFDVALRARFGNGGILNGGVSLGNTRINNLGEAIINRCDTAGTTLAANFQRELFCELDNRQDQIKFNVSYPIWKGIQAAAVYQNIPGTNQEAAVIYTNAQIAPLLGRNLGACGASATCTATVTVPVIEPNTQREKRGQQLDVRVSRTFKAGSATIRPGFDIYNITNSNDVLSITTTYSGATGGNWLRPGTILPGRLYKFNVLVNF